LTKLSLGYEAISFVNYYEITIIPNQMDG
jgi:hypothetical protein